MTTDPENAIEVRNLSKTYDGKRNAVDGISFHVSRGEIYGLLGKNGAGKSTTIKMLTTLIKPTSGEISILGMDPSKHSLQIRKRIGVVQQSESFDFATVENNLRIYAMLWEVPREIADARIEEVLELFDLADMRKVRAFELSGGQKKKLQVARELIHDMDILFLDEPTVGMDPIMRRRILDSIRKRADNGLTVMFTTHFLDEADYLCDRIGIMSDGIIRAEGTSYDLKEKYGGMRTLEIVLRDQISADLFARIKASILSGEMAEEVHLDRKQLKILGRNITRNLDQILSLFRSAGIAIDGINLRDATLDDVFIEVVSA
ncbi:MAG: ABC transporter ATP-binding protein [Candidatus Thermoplasmatota archaeon]|nr:ABC transporter ATP-binding protein [Candidatus Thermoplasmatota archaeon]